VEREELTVVPTVVAGHISLIPVEREENKRRYKTRAGQRKEEEGKREGRALSLIPDMESPAAQRAVAPLDSVQHLEERDNNLPSHRLRNHEHGQQFASS